MSTIAPPATIAGPIFAPSVGGLLSVVNFEVDQPPHRWLNGAQWLTESCAPLGGYGPADCDTDEVVGLVPRDLDPTEDCTLSGATAFTITATWSGTPSADTDPAAKALHRLRRGEEAAVEHELWTGALGSSPALIPSLTAATDPAQDLTPSGGAVAPAAALALLEGYGGEVFGGQSVLHLPRAVASLLPQHITRRAGGLATSVNNNLVSAGNGYHDAGADVWAFITPPLVGRATPATTTPPVFDPENNNLVVIAERSFLLGWDQCAPIGAVKINLGGA